MEHFSVLTSPSFIPDDRYAAALARAKAVLGPLFDPVALGPMTGLPIARKVEGDCRLCATYGPLSFEHTPAQSTGNNKRVRGAGVLATLAGDDPTEFPREGSFQSQRGIGARVLCKPCNERTGAELVPGYAELANVLTERLNGVAYIENEHLHMPGVIDLDLQGFRFGAVARQAIVMNLSVSGGAAVTRRWPRLRDVVFGSVEPLPDAVRLGVSLAYSPRVRLSPPVAQIEADGSLLMFSEVAAMPFAWKLAFGDGSEPAPLAGAVDVSDWTLLDPASNVGSYSVTLPVGAIATGIPGDARDPGTVRAEIERQRGRRVARARGQAAAGSRTRASNLEMGIAASRDIAVGPFTGACYWCGDPADSDEDIVSQWIEREIAPPPALVVGGPTLRKFEHGRVRRWQVQRLATKKARIRAVCQRCNNGWMSTQERKVQPLLAPLIRGHRRLLTHEDQLKIAFWACIKSAICDARPGNADGGLASEATRQAIYVERRPPDDMMVRLAAFEGAYDLQVVNPFGAGLGAQSQALAQWATSMVLGHLVVQIVGRTGSVRPRVLDQLMGGVHDGKSFTVWPPQPSSVEWPPREILTVETLRAFFTELLPGIDVPDDALMEKRDPCPRCGEQHGPYVRSVPVPEV